MYHRKKRNRPRERSGGNRVMDGFSATNEKLIWRKLTKKIINNLNEMQLEGADGNSNYKLNNKTAQEKAAKAVLKEVTNW